MFLFYNVIYHCIYIYYICFFYLPLFFPCGSSYRLQYPVFLAFLRPPAVVLPVPLKFSAIIQQYKKATFLDSKKVYFFGSQLVLSHIIFLNSIVINYCQKSIIKKQIENSFVNNSKISTNNYQSKQTAQPKTNAPFKYTFLIYYFNTCCLSFFKSGLFSSHVPSQTCRKCSWKRRT